MKIFSFFQKPESHMKSSNGYNRDLRNIRKEVIHLTAQEFSTRVLEVEGMLYRVAYGILLNQSDCADAVQEALMRGWEKLHTLREEEYFRTWLTRILINQCYNMIRRRRFFLPLDSARTVAAPEDADIALHDAIARLDDKLRLPIVLHYMEGYSLEEIARMLSQPVGTVKTRLMRARKQLRAALSEEDAPAASRRSVSVPDDSISKYTADHLSDPELSSHTPYSRFCAMPSFGAAAAAEVMRKPNLLDLLLFMLHTKFTERRKSRHE